MDFSNQVAIVTGAGSQRGIGRQVAKQLAEKGAHVVLGDINADGVREAVRDILETGGHASSTKIDVTIRSDIDRAVKDVVGQHGRIDVIVNAAGISLPARVLDVTEEEWNKIFNVNVKSIYFMTQSVIPHMKKQQYGRIINISSVAGKIGGGIFGGSHYAASKAAVAGYTKAVAREMAAFGITSNCVAPGTIDTDLIAGIEPDRVKRILVGRKGEPGEVASIIVFLASNLAGYITGEEVDINGGLHID